MLRQKIGVLLLLASFVAGAVFLVGFQERTERAQVVLARPISLEDAVNVVQEASAKGTEAASLLHLYVGRQNTFTGGIAIDRKRPLDDQIRDILVRQEEIIGDLIEQAEYRLPYAQSDEERMSTEALIDDLRARLDDFRTNGIQVYALNVEGPSTAIRQLLEMESIKAIHLENGEVVQR